MEDHPIKRIPISITPSIEEICSEHHHTGNLPCPWPGCTKGIEEDIFVATTAAALQEIPTDIRYIRKEWKSFDNEQRYSWDLADHFASFQASQFITEENIRRCGPEPEPLEQIFHYTTLEGLKGIIQNGEIWLTDYQYMNDLSEILHGLELAREVIQKMRGKPQYCGKEALFESFQNALRESPEDRICIACFSIDDGDSLSQWRAYSKKGAGVSIGFNTRATRFWSPWALLDRVTYDDVEQRKKLENLFHIYSVLVSWDHNKITVDIRGNETPLDKSKEIIPFLIISELLRYLTYFKNKSFSDEHEARWVCRESKRISTDIGFQAAPKHFRISNNKIIPYMTSSDFAKINPRNDKTNSIKLPITEIVVGPQENIEVVISGIRELLDYYGYESVSIRKSRVPFRP